MTEADPSVPGRPLLEQRGLRSNPATGGSLGAGPEPRNRGSRTRELDRAEAARARHLDRVPKVKWGGPEPVVQADLSDGDGSSGGHLPAPGVSLETNRAVSSRRVARSARIGGIRLDPTPQSWKSPTGSLLHPPRLPLGFLGRWGSLGPWGFLGSRSSGQPLSPLSKARAARHLSFIQYNRPALLPA